MQRPTIENFRHKSANRRYCAEIKNPGTKNVGTEKTREQREK
jgi:hypothetical protein